MLIKPVKNMKKVIYALILPLVVVSGVVFANREIKNETSKKSAPKPLSAAEMKAEREKWYMEAVVTSLSLSPGSRSGFGVKARINGFDYFLGFGPENANEFQQLQSLKVNDKIIIRSHSVFNVLYTPKDSYPIVPCDYVERDGKIIYKRAPRKGGC
jgi:nitrate reductase cytochrome c-type subunit